MGIPVPAQVRVVLERALDSAAHESGALRRSDPLGWHLTLAFVGELADERVPVLRAAVAEAIASADPPPLELTVDGADRFGSRVLFAAVTDRPPDALVRLGTTLQTAIDGAGLHVERREVRPHVTVARGGRSVAVTPDTVQALSDALPTEPPLRWSPTVVAVYRAVDRDGPARYVVDASVPLAGG